MQNHRSKIKVAALFIIAALLLWALLSFVLYTEKAWICAGCGSWRSETHWHFGIVTSRSCIQSSLGEWIKGHGIAHDHDWRSIKGTSKTILNRAVSRRHGKAPPIYGMPEPFMEQFINSSSEEEIASLLDVLQNGNESEQEKKIEQIVEKLLK